MTQQDQQPTRGNLPQRQWPAHVQAFRRSGLSRAEYCRRQNISYHALTYWQRKLSRPGTGRSVPALVPVPLAGNLVSHLSQIGSGALRVILPGRLSIEVGDGFSSATLSRLLAILEGR
jgi:hypothetical protein